MEVARMKRIMDVSIRFVGQKCKECNSMYLIPRSICPNCGQELRTSYPVESKSNLRVNFEEVATK